MHLRSIKCRQRPHIAFLPEQIGRKQQKRRSTLGGLEVRRMRLQSTPRVKIPSAFLSRRRNKKRQWKDEPWTSGVEPVSVVAFTHALLCSNARNASACPVSMWWNICAWLSSSFPSHDHNAPSNSPHRDPPFHPGKSAIKKEKKSARNRTKGGALARGVEWSRGLEVGG